MRHSFACAVVLIAAFAAPAGLTDRSGNPHRDCLQSQARADIFSAAGRPLAQRSPRFDFGEGFDPQRISLIDPEQPGPAVITLIDAAGFTCTFELEQPIDTIAVYGATPGDLFTVAARTPSEADGIFTPALNAAGAGDDAMRLDLNLAAASPPETVPFIPAPGSALLAVFGAAAVAYRRKR